MSRKQLLKDAILQAEKFLDRAQIALKEIVDYQAEISKSGPGYRRTGEPSPSRKFAAAKRSSLDLSEALVALRRGK